MTKYKRMTKHSDLGTLHADDINGDEQPLCELTVIDTDNLINRLCKLEDKIESGELCEREEVRKETAKEILQKLYNETEYFSVQYIIKELAAQYGVEVEE